MDPYLKELFARPNDFQLVDKIYVRIAQKADGSDLKILASLPKEQKIVLDVWGAGGIIGNGGFQYLFEADLADMPGMADSYDAIGASRAANAFRQALAHFPGSKPHADVDERLEYLEKRGPAVKEKLERLSEEVWASDREALRKLSAFVRKNQQAFADLPPTQWEDINELKRQDLPAPPLDADEEAVIRWLRSIDVTVRRWEDAFHDVRQTTPPPDGNPIVSLRLSQYRNSTDSELEHISRIHVLKQVREFDLEESFVTATGLAHLPEFPELRLLSLADTDVTDEQLTVVSALPRLESLDLSKTGVTPFGLRKLQGLQSLRHLDLSGTLIDDAALQSLASLSALRSLELRQTRINGDGLAALAELPLERLMLMEAEVTDDGLRSLTSLEQLKELELRDIDIGDVTMGHLSRMQNLEDLCLSGTKVTDDGLAHLARLTNLKSLDLSGTPIEGRGLRHFEGLKGLEVLQLYSTRCDDDGVMHLAKLRSLKRLSMGETRITDACLGSIAQLTALEELSIDDAGIQGGPELRRLENLRALTWISLPKQVEGSPNVRYLQQKLPDTRFSF